MNVLPQNHFLPPQNCYLYSYLFFYLSFFFRYMSAIKSFTVKQINKIQGKHRHLSRESGEGIREGIGAD